MPLLSSSSSSPFPITSTSTRLTTVTVASSSPTSSSSPTRGPKTMPTPDIPPSRTIAIIVGVLCVCLVFTGLAAWYNVRRKNKKSEHEGIMNARRKPRGTPHPPVEWTRRGPLPSGASGGQRDKGNGEPVASTERRSDDDPAKITASTADSADSVSSSRHRPADNTTRKNPAVDVLPHWRVQERMKSPAETEKDVSRRKVLYGMLVKEDQHLHCRVGLIRAMMDDA